MIITSAATLTSTFMKRCSRIKSVPTHIGEPLRKTPKILRIKSFLISAQVLASSVYLLLELVQSTYTL